MIKEYYIYSHTQIGYDKPFYIGCATKALTGNVFERAYRSAYCGERTEWADFASRVAYIVKIEGEFSSREEAFLGESKLIKLYGRIDQKTGCLVNQTDGGLGIINPSSVLKLSQNQKRLIKNKEAILASRALYSIEVFKYSLDGKYLCSYPSISQAAKESKSKQSEIHRAIKRKNKTAAGFQWRVFKIESGIEPVIINKFQKKIRQYNFSTGELIGLWNSASEASTNLNISRSAINNCLTGKSKSSAGSGWEFID